MMLYRSLQTFPGNSTSTIHTLLSKPFVPRLPANSWPFFPRPDWSYSAKHTLKEESWKCYYGPRGVGKTTAVMQTLAGQRGVLPVWLPSLCLYDLNHFFEVANYFKDQWQSKITVFSDESFYEPTPSQFSTPAIKPEVLAAFQNLQSKGLIDFICTVDDAQDAVSYGTQSMELFEEISDAELETFLLGLSYNVHEIGHEGARLNFIPPGNVIPADERYLFTSRKAVRDIIDALGMNLSKIQEYIRALIGPPINFKYSLGEFIAEDKRVYQLSHKE